MGTRKMTNEDKAKAYLMRLSGNTIQQVADKFCVSKQYISQCFPTRKNERSNSFKKKCIYPNIKTFLDEQGLSYSQFSLDCGIAPQTIYRALSGTCEPSKITIDAILKATGMTYEKAFYQEVENG